MILKKIEEIDKKILKLIDIGQMIFFLVSALGILILMVHYKLYISAELYLIGVEVFKNKENNTDDNTKVTMLIKYKEKMV